MCRPDRSPRVEMLLSSMLFEYLMAGLPVLASDLVAVAGVINRYDVGRTVTSVEPVGAEKAINAMVADPAALGRMRASGLAAAKIFCCERENEELARLYNRIGLGSG